MAFTAASLSPFSSLSISNATRRLSLPPPKPTFSFSPKPSPSSLKFAPIRASDEEKDPSLFEYSTPEDDDEPFPFQEPPEGYEEPPMFDDGPEETEDEIAALFEEVYGPAYSGVSVLGNDILVMDSKFKKATKWGGTEVVKDRVKDGFEERVVQVRRVTKVVKGGKNMQFRAVVVVGDKQGHVGVGVGKAQEIAEAVAKSAVNARRNIINVPMTKYATFPHRADGYYGAATVMLRPALAGSGVTAGGVVRVILELAGIKNGLGKQLRSKNALNNARATLEAIKQMRQFSEVAEDRGIPMEQMWQ